MPRICAMSALVLVFLGGSVFRVMAQTPHPLEEEMSRLKVHTALVVPSQAIDDTPVWSPDGHYLAFDAAGKWYKLNLEKLTLVGAKWHGKLIGVISGKPEVSSILVSEVDIWKKSQLHGELEVAAKSGLKVKIERHELSSSVALSKGEQTIQLWQTEMESCEELAVSPSEKSVAYLCEQNGILVTDVEAALQANGLATRKAR